MLAIAGEKTTMTLSSRARSVEHRRSVLAADADLDMPDRHLLADVDADSNIATVAAGGAVEDAAHPRRQCRPRTAIARRDGRSPVGALAPRRVQGLRTRGLSRLGVRSGSERAGAR